MEYVEITLGRLFNYNEFLYKLIKTYLIDNVENDERLKIFYRCKKTLYIISKHYYKNAPKKQYLNNLLNEIYTTLRKIQFLINDHKNSEYMYKPKTLQELQKGLERNNYIIEDYLMTMNKYNNKYENDIPENFKPILPLTKNNISLTLSIQSLEQIPYSCENTFMNLTLYMDNVYYIETNDKFGYFYFYRTKDCWFWSPPKQTDADDIWIECPQIKINEGYWNGVNIPDYVAEFIKWLDLFFPDIPLYYLKNAYKTPESSENSDKNYI